VGDLVIQLQVVERKAKVFAALEQLGDLGVAEQGFGWDAAPVQTDASEVLALDDRCFQSELGGADRGNVPTRPPPMTMTS